MKFYTTLITQIGLLLSFGLFNETKGQTFDAFIQSQVDELTYDSIYSRMLKFEELGVKMAGTAELDATRDWIIELYESWGYNDIMIDSFNYGGSPVQNIIVTKTGTLFPETYLIVDGHYDTYGGPGVNDNGSGTAVVLEIARMMKDLPTDYSLRFIHFTVEEMGLVGSTHYVDYKVVPEDMDIKLVFNIDEVGGVAGDINNTITCERDEWAPTSNNAASAAYTDTLASITELYSSLNTDISYAYGSDYVPFMENGYVVTGFYETNESPYTHSSNDVLTNLDPEYVFEVARAALAASMYFSGAHEVISRIHPDGQNIADLSIKPNPFHHHLQIQNDGDTPATLKLLDLNGQQVFSRRIDPNTKVQIELDFPAGIYFYQFWENHSTISSGKLICR